MPRFAQMVSGVIGGNPLALIALCGVCQACGATEQAANAASSGAASGSGSSSASAGRSGTVAAPPSAPAPIAGQPASVTPSSMVAAGVGARASGTAGVAGSAAGMIAAAAAGGVTAGVSGTAGTATAAAGVTGSAGSAGSSPQAGAGSVAEDACGPIPTQRQTAAKPKAVVMNALVEYHTREDNQFVGVHAVLTVPAKPPPSGVIFVWPGTQTFPGGPTVQPVGEGVLQPVLTWGSSCVPGALPGHDTWWISPVYVNDASSVRELQGCHGGPVIRTAVGDRLDLDMRLDGTAWNQKVIDLNSKQQTEFRIDLRGQLQQRVLFEIELKTSAKPTEDMIFDNIVLTMRDPEPGACALNNGGMNDYATQSRVSADGRHCCIDRIILRAAGVPATSNDP